MEPRGALNYSISHRQAPNDRERALLASYSEQCNQSLLPSFDNDPRVIAALTVLGSVMASRNHGSDSQSLLRIYVADLSDLPCWAVEESCNAFRRGEIGDGRWLPAPGEIRRDCLTRIAAVRGEIERVRRILDAEIIKDEPIDPERRARLADMLRGRLRTPLDPPTMKGEP